MNLKRVEWILVVFLILLVAVGVYVALRNLSFFNVKTINVTLTGPVSEVRPDMQRILNPLKGLNIFEISTKKLEKNLSSFDEVESVTVKRFYPDTLEITINYSNLRLKAYCVDGDEITYFFIKEDELIQTSEETWSDFDQLGCVELNPAYAQMVLKWGEDSGFKSMVPMVEYLTTNNLITSIKYDNNNGSEFGRLVLWLPAFNVQLYVREVVSTQRLEEALSVIAQQSSASGEVVIFDLYSMNLVKRT
jgi:hypothetical protein